MTKVSIVVPIYNVETYLDRCLSALKTQTFKDIEVLCINDGSTDHSQAIIDRFVKDDKRFLSYIKKNGGLSDARNYGLKLVKAGFVMFLDSDDFAQPDMVGKAYQRMIDDKLDCVIFDYYQYFDHNQSKETIEMPFEGNRIYSFDTNPELIAYVNNAAWNKLYKTDIFRQHQIEYPYGYRHQDLGTTLRYMNYCKRIGFIREPLYNYLADRPNNLTQTFDAKIDQILDMIAINVKFFKENGLFDKYYEELKYLSGINLMTSLRKLRQYHDQEFALEFIDRAFDFIKESFPDYPKCEYPLNQEAHAIIYSHRLLLKWYYRYNQLRRRK